MRELLYTTYYDKVYGGWIGKCIGGNIGARVENIKCEMGLEEHEIFPDEIPPNDDLDLQLLWLQVLEEKGIYISSKDLAEAWEQRCWYPFNEYGYFLHNIERKIMPPVSGWFNNQYFRQSMGSPIRSEIWGMISPGNAQLAMDYAYKDATLDHDTESVWAEQMLAAMEAEAFFATDLQRLIDYGVSLIPDDSDLKRCIRFVQQQFAQKVPWQTARHDMLTRFGHPDASKAVQNLGITILALLYGEMDFGRTQLISLNCGYDTDCTCATSGAILGLMVGASRLPALWKEQARDTFVIGIDLQRPTNRISDLATDTCRVGVAMTHALNAMARITDVPLDLEIERISLKKPARPVEISVTYQGLPAIGSGESTTVQLHLTNQSPFPQTGQLHLGTASACEITPQSLSIELQPGETALHPVQVTLSDQTRRIPSAFVIDASLEQTGEKCLHETIGLAGAQPYSVIGPFWDLYDTRLHQASPLYDPATHHVSRPAGAGNFNNYVNLDRAYIDETTFATLPAGRHYNAPQDKLPIDEWFGIKGPACWYLVQDIESPTEREVRLMIGNNDAFKIWLNDELVARNAECWFWMPYNHDITVRFKKGVNRLVLKLLRTGATCEFSLGFAIPNTHVRWMNDLVSVVIPA